MLLCSLILFGQHADQNFIYNFSWNIRLLIILNWLLFKGFCYMDVITPGFLGPSQNVQYEMKKLPPCVQNVPKTFFPRSITPRCHSFAA